MATISQFQHCTSEECQYTLSHTAEWCGYNQPRRCGCAFCYNESDEREAEKRELSDLCLTFLMPPKFPGGSWTLNPDALADAIIEAGWSKN